MQAYNLYQMEAEKNKFYPHLTWGLEQNIEVFQCRATGKNVFLVPTKGGPKVWYCLYFTPYERKRLKGLAAPSKEKAVKKLLRMGYDLVLF